MTSRRCRAGPLVAVLAGVLAGLAVVVAPASAEPEDCALPADMLEAAAKLPALAERLKAHRPVTIVAIGGASTVGRAAGSTELAYPHRLERALAHDFPGAPVTVVNKGVARQSAKQMLERFPTDVFAEDPVLVIWETGINDAVRGTDVEDFAQVLQSGIEDLKNRSMDVILIDMQFSRSSTTVIDFDQYMKALHRVGELNEVYVFPRFAMMRYWSERNVFNFDEVAEGDRAKLAARVYECLGQKLAQVIAHAVR